MRKRVCLLFFMLPVFAVAQNRYDTPASATFNNTYVPMSYNDMLLNAAAMVWKEKQDQEKFERYTQSAYMYLKEKKIDLFLSYAHAALNTGYYNSSLYYNMGISYYLLKKKYKGKKYLKKASKEGLDQAKYVLNAIKRKEEISYSWFLF